MAPRVEVVAPERFARAALDALLSLATESEAPVIGLPTGRTPVGMYLELARAVERGRVDVSAWRPFAIDEYVAPRNHRCSNRSFFERYWEAIPGAPPVEQFDPEAPDLDAEARRFAERLGQAGGLHLVILGIGTNGHLAFNEPRSDRDSTARLVALHADSRASAAPCWGEQTPGHGLTLGLAELLAAPSVLLLANGSGKAAIVARALRGPVSPECPASYLQEHPGMFVLLDEAAAAG